jgi:hypothetical protein
MISSFGINVQCTQYCTFVHAVFLKIFIKWQVLKTLLSVLNIDKPHKDGTMKSESSMYSLAASKPINIYVTFNYSNYIFYNTISTDKQWLLGRYSLFAD